ncbi:MAG: pyrroline-5-carboxylate reductase [Actinobacteria bacterium]|nr:pyrroline-5-carboxylate reductase [Actinomycetota bacterium]
MSTTVGVVGAGNMGSAFVRGWLRSADPELSILVYDVAEDRARDLACVDCVAVASSLEDLGRRSQFIVIVVKPKDTAGVLQELRPVLGGKVLISSAAGVTLEKIRSAAGPGPTLVRVMPNLGVELGEGVVAISPEPETPEDVVDSVQVLFESLGMVEVVSEELLDAVTAVSGSSIGFLALVLEAMEDGAVRVGMPRGTARSFVRQTAVAAALLLQRYPGSAADIKDQVASPGGTTIAGLAALEDGAVRGAFVRAIEAATERGRKLRDTGPRPVVE